MNETKEEEKTRLLHLLKGMTSDEINELIESKGKPPKLRYPFIPIKK